MIETSPPLVQTESQPVCLEPFSPPRSPPFSSLPVNMSEDDTMGAMGAATLASVEQSGRFRVRRSEEPIAADLHLLASPRLSSSSSFSLSLGRPLKRDPFSSPALFSPLDFHLWPFLDSSLLCFLPSPALSSLFSLLHPPSSSRPTAEQRGRWCRCRKAPGRAPPPAEKRAPRSAQQQIPSPSYFFHPPLRLGFLSFLGC